MQRFSIEVESKVDGPYTLQFDGHAIVNGHIKMNGLELNWDLISE